MLRSRSLFALTICSMHPILNNRPSSRVIAVAESNDNEKKSDFDLNSFVSRISSIAKESIASIDTKLLISPLDSDTVNEASKQLHNFFESGVPGKISFGFATGFCSGYFIKKSTKIAAFTIGGIFAVVQYFSSQGYIQVNYNRLSQEFEQVFDLNKDGKIDGLDFQIAYKKVLYVLQYNLPSGGGFSAGFLLGLRN